MSYEGYEQVICENGHRYEVDQYKESNLCYHCKTPPAWSNGVDDTNGDSTGIIPEEQFAKLLISKAVVKICNLNHNHMISPPIYRLPKEGELIRYHRDYITGKMVPQ